MRWAAPLLILALAWWFWPAAPLEARHGAGDCRRLALTDTQGRAILGVEDIARLGDALILSAHDRLAAEAGGAATGGLYRLALADLEAPGPLERIGEVAHPHGIDADATRLAVVERRYGPAGLEGARVRVLTHAGATLALHEGDDLCAANDVALDGDRLLVSLDRAGCPGLALADALGRASGRVVALEDGGRRVVAAGLAWANGLALTPRGPLVAETRGERLLDLRTETATTLEAAPDNLSRDGERVLAAVHPSLIRLALHRHGWWPRAPSRVLDVRDGRTRVLFDDPDGRLWPGATVAVPVPGGLVIGAIRAPGVLVCGAKGVA